MKRLSKISNCAFECDYYFIIIIIIIMRTKEAGLSIRNNSMHITLATLIQSTEEVGLSTKNYVSTLYIGSFDTEHRRSWIVKQNSVDTHTLAALTYKTAQGKMDCPTKSCQHKYISSFDLQQSTREVGLSKRILLILIYRQLWLSEQVIFCYLTKPGQCTCIGSLCD